MVKVMVDSEYLVSLVSIAADRKDQLQKMTAKANRAENEECVQRYRAVAAEGNARNLKSRCRGFEEDLISQVKLIESLNSLVTGLKQQIANQVKIILRADTALALAHDDRNHEEALKLNAEHDIKSLLDLIISSRYHGFALYLSISELQTLHSTEKRYIRKENTNG